MSLWPRQARHRTAAQPFVVQETPGSFAAEAYRVLRTNLRYANPDAPPRRVLVTSAGVGEGKSTTVVNLGGSIAQAEQTVLLVDADLRKPALHSVFQREKTVGLSTYLAGDAPLEAVCFPTAVPRLSIVPSGAIPPNPAELLGSRRMREFLDAVRERYDMVLLDSPPILAVSDACALAPLADGVLLVVQSGRLPGGEIRRAKEQVEAVHGRVVATVLNFFSAAASGYSRRYYDRYESYYYYRARSAAGSRAPAPP